MITLWEGAAGSYPIAPSFGDPRRSNDLNSLAIGPGDSTLAAPAVLTDPAPRIAHASKPAVKFEVFIKIPLLQMLLAETRTVANKNRV